MKKILTLALLLCCAIFTQAQTTATTALPLTMGDVSYSFSDASGYKTVYYTYTAASSDELLTFTSERAAVVTFTFKDAVTSQRLNATSACSGTVQLLPLAKGTSILIEAKKYNTTQIKFNAKSTPIDIAAGQTCSNPVEIQEGKTFYLAANPSYAPGYLEYTATKNGTLSMMFYRAPSGLTISEGCDGTPISLPVSTNKDYTYSVSTAVQAGKTYILSGTCYSDVMGIAELVELEVGKSCDAPFDAVDGKNTLPAAAGEYWYAYTSLQDGYLRLNAGTEKLNGKVRILKNCTALNPLYEVENNFNARVAVEKNTIYLICIEKTAGTAAEQSFDIAVEAEKPGDKFNNPIAIEPGKHYTPVYKGKVYYKLTMPAQDCFLTVSSDYDFKNGATRMSLYSIDYSAVHLNEGVNLLQRAAAANDEYILLWECYEDNGEFPFTVEYDVIEQGEVAGNPITTTLGENAVTKGMDTRYYLHTMSVNGFMMVTVADKDVKVEFLSKDGSTNYYAMPDTDCTKVDGVYGDKVLIKLSNLTEATTFTVKEREFTDGETCGLAHDTEGGVIALSANSGNHWYRYVVEDNGMLTISTNIEKQMYTKDAIAHSGLSYRLGNCSEDEINVPSNSNGGDTYSQKMMVSKGDIIIVNVRTISPQEGKTLTINLRDFTEGESPETAYPLVIGENKLKAANEAFPVWYYINLGPCDFRIETSSSANYFWGELYNSSNTSSPLTKSNIDLASDKYVLKYNVTNEDRFYFKVSYANEGTPITVSGVIATEISSLPTDGKATVTLNGRTLNVNAAATVYDMSGKVVSKLNGAQCSGVVLERGAYVVKTAEGSLKVLVK